MKFRPCIDIHDGFVKQIVGSSLNDEKGTVLENFVSERDAAFYANLFKKDGIRGAHVINLNGKNSDGYHASKAEALKALKEYPGGLQIGGSVTSVNAKSYIDAGASHVIVTSYVFKDGEILFDNLRALRYAVGADKVVLDLSARKSGRDYYVVTDRWQKFTNFRVTPQVFKNLSEYCDEFLVHAVDTEGKGEGIDSNLIKILADARKSVNREITYAGGISSYDDIKAIDTVSNGTLNFTVGSALDLYGGKLSYEEIVKKYK